MGRIGRFSLLSFVVLAVLGATVAPAHAATSEFRIFLDLDNNAATGCSVTTVDGPFDGVEQILITTVVTTSAVTGEVTAVERQVCSDPVTDTFTAPTPITPPPTPPWSIGPGLGTDGSDVVETLFPLDGLTPREVRVALEATSGRLADAVLDTSGDGSGNPIILVLAAIFEIPTLSPPMFLALVLLLALLGFGALRHPSMRTLGLVLILTAAAGTAWAACVLDGQISDWVGESPLALDPVDSVPGVEIHALFGKEDGGNLCFRIDVDLVFNEAPTAVDDSFTVDEDSSNNSLDVLTNDSDPDTDPLTLTAVGTPDQGGTAVINGSNIDYTPAADFNGIETFTYTISDGNGGTDTATVTVTVTPVNDPPVALPDSFLTQEDTALVVAAPGVLQNDSDIDGDLMTAVLDTDVSDGTLSLNADGSFTYTPDPDFNGSDSFTYHASDGTVDSNTVTVSITVGPVNDGPNAVDDMFATDEDTVLAQPAAGVLLNDFDTEGDNLSVTAFDAVSAQGATVTVNADGSFTYDPTGSATLQALAGGATANDTFDYTVTEDGGNLTDVGTVTIEVTGVDDPPTAVDDTATVTEDDPATTIDVRANDDDPDGGTNTITSVTQPANGTVVITNAGADLTYQPDPNYCNDALPADTFTYTLSPGGSTATVSVSVTCVNDNPVADDETISAACNIEAVVEQGDQAAEPNGQVFRTISDNVLVGDSDPVEGDAISIVAASGATSDTTAPFDITASGAGGTVQLLADGSFEFTPEAGDRGVAATFQYTIEDADMGQATATVTVNIGSTCVWFVDNTNNGGADDTGTGTSSDPFTSLVDEAGPDDVLADDAEDASQAGDIVYVFEGNSRSGDPYVGGYSANANETILGEGVDLVVDLGSGPETLFDSTANNKPLVEAGLEIGFVVTDSGGVEIAGFDVASDTVAILVSSGAGDNVVSIHDNELDAGTIGLRALTTAGSLEIAADGNTAISGSVQGVLLDGSVGGTLYVTSFCGNEVSGDASGTGILADTVVFDTDPSDADFTGDEVVCTDGTLIGDAANRVDGSGLVLMDVTGALDLAALSAWVGSTPADATDEIAVHIVGDGVYNEAAGTGFQFTPGPGTIDSSDGPAFLVDTARLEFLPPADAVTTVVSTNSNTVGIGLSNVSRFFTVVGTTTIDSTASHGIEVTNSSVQAAFIGEFLLSNTGGHGVSLTNQSADFLVLDQAPGMVNGTANSLITGTTGDAVNSVGHTDDIRVYADITNTSGNSVDIRDHGGIFKEMLFAGLITDSGLGINLDNNDQGALPATARFTGGLDLDTGANTAFTAINGGNVEVLSDGVSTTADTTTGTLVNIADTTITANGVFFDSTSKTGGANGILLDDVGAGAFTSDAGSIANQTSRAVDVQGGSGDVTIDNTLSSTAAGRSVEVTNHTGGTVAFNGAITDPGLGINLSSNGGATMSFTGQLDLDTTTNTAFNATGGGTVNVTGSGNDVDTTTGTGVNIVNTTIGASDVTFQSVSANGATNGIVLNNTGTSGAFEVTGTGTTDESGGVIDNTTGDAVVLSQVDDVTLRNMRLGEATTAQGDAPDSNIAIAGDAIEITDSSNLTFSNLRIADTSGDGIKGTGVTNLSLSDSEIFNVGLDAGSDETAFDFGDTTGGTDDNLLGTVTITDTVFDGMQEFGIYIYNDTGSLDLDISGGRFSNQRTNNAEAGILVETDGTATMDVSVTGITCDVLEGAACVFAQALNGTLDLVATGNTVEDGGSVSNFNNTDGFNLATGNGTLNFDISDNSIQRNRGHGVRLAANFGGTLNGQVTGNDIDGDGPFPPAASAQPILVQIDGGGAGDPSAFILIDDNDIDDVVDTILELIDIEARDGVTNLDVTVTNNRLNQDAGATLGDGDHGIEIRARNSASVRAEVSSNVVSSPDASINLDVEDSSSMEATVVGNTLSSSGDDEFQANTEDAGTSLCLDLRSHTSGVFDLDEDAGTFTLENFGSVAGDNTGATVSVGAGISADGGTCIEPTDPTFPAAPP